ncbi:hypothetical protein FA15DRAFT_699978 [Coprinopsis marcescibilis]|uniref:MARVEL domain-containing protein n=1 Tax=Coprinopsis marcescibilis TaxID=230819 RepID=A0A5C3LBE1_COPMA|nr:hypothetical protein FA15DRAFT_699978 [Coprinopsis marcescibilis]
MNGIKPNNIVTLSPQTTTATVIVTVIMGPTTTSSSSPALPVARLLHTLTYLIASFTVFFSALAWLLLDKQKKCDDQLFCGLMQAYLLPFLIVAGIGIVIGLFDMYKHVKRTSWTRWLLCESVLGALLWVGLAIGGGFIATPALTAKACSATQSQADSLLYTDCVLPVLLWLGCLAGALNFIWGLGLWYLCDREEKKRDRPLSTSSIEMPTKT